MSMKGVLKGELIGSQIEIVESKNKTLVGKKGKITDETKNTVTIQTGRKKIKVIKSHVTFMIKNKKIQGKSLVSRPEDRLKK